jgi:two-component system, cell cycle sensor histidine kinase and response regulator CckA
MRIHATTAMTADEQSALEALDLPVADAEVHRAALAHAPFGVALLALDGRIRFAHPVLCRMLGYAEDELVGRTLVDLTFEQDRELVEQRWARATDGKSLRLELRCLRKSGDPIWLELSLGAERDPAGAVHAVWAYAQDITERRRAEQSMRENEEKLRIAFEQSPTGMSIIGADGTYLAVNPAACRIVGYSREELLAGTLSRITHPDDVERGAEWIRKCIAGEPCEEEFEKRFIHKDGRVIWGVVTSTWLRDPSGKPRLSVSHLRDITSRKQAELALRDSEARLQEAHELSRMGHWQLCPESRSMIWSPGVFRLLGREAPDTAPSFESFLGPVHAKDRAMLEAALAQTASSGQACDLVYRIILPSGEERHLRMVARLDPERAGAERCVTGVLQDVTAMRQAEEDRVRLEAQLHRAQRMEAIGQLAGGVAHDFNNLLTAMGGNADVALGLLWPDSAVRAHLVEIRKAVDSAANLTRQLLAFSRRQVIAPKVLDLNDVVRQLSKMLVRLLGEDLEFACRLGEGVGRVRIDPGQMDQILINLAVNARDAMAEGGRLTLETANAVLDVEYCRQHPNVAPGPYVLLAVSDTGIGMTPEVKRRLFEPFFTTKEVGRGTGLGLAMVYGAVKQHGGHIEVDSEPGQGATFRVYLPRVEAMPEATSPESFRPSAGGSEGVLLVEDDGPVRTLTETFLAGLGYTVYSFASGNAALAALGTLPGSIALLITDVVMPGISGKALADECVRVRPGLRVLFTSGYTSDEIIHRGVLDRSIDFLGKPYSLDLLARRVREALDRRI